MLPPPLAAVRSMIARSIPASAAARATAKSTMLRATRVLELNSAASAAATSDEPNEQPQHGNQGDPILVALPHYLSPAFDLLDLGSERCQ